MKFREKFGLLIVINSAIGIYHIEDDATMIAAVVGIVLGVMLFLWGEK